MSRIRNSPRFKGLTVFISVLNIFLSACTENPENQKEIEWQGDFDLRTFFSKKGIEGIKCVRSDSIS